MSDGPFGGGATGAGGGPFAQRPVRRVGDAPPPPGPQTPFAERPRPASPPPQPPPQQPRGSRGGTGGRGGGIAIVVLIIGLLAGLIVVLFFEPGFIDQINQSDDDGASGATPQLTTRFATTLRESLPEVPDVLGAASPIYNLRSPGGAVGPFELSLRLSTPTQDARNLGAYTWDGGEWERLGPAELASDGVSARVTLNELPDNVVILRRLQFRDVLAGRVPRGEEPSADVVDSLTIVHLEGWNPTPSGGLTGGIPAVPRTVTQSIWPTIWADPEQAVTVNDILASDQLRQAHIGAVQLQLQHHRFDGVDIDYREVSPALRGQFSSFITELADQLHRDGRGISVHIPLTTSGGVGEGAYDLTVLGAAADFIIVEPPLDPTIHQAAIDASMPTLLSRIPREKVLLAVSSDAVVSSGGLLSTTTQRAALGVASMVSIRETSPYLAGERVTLQGTSIQRDSAASGLRWDEATRTVSFSYPDLSGNQVTVWIENRFSASFKLRTVEDLQLGGVYLSNVSADRANANLWPAVAAFLETGEVDLRLPNPILFSPVFIVEAGALSGASGSGWQVWELPPAPGDYEAQLVISDGDVRVGTAIVVPVVE